MKTEYVKSIFSELPKKALSEEVFETLLESKDMKLERIISTGQTTPEGEWLDQDQDEWVMLLQGHARLTFEDQVDVSMTAGDYLLINAQQKHRVSWTDPDEVCVWLGLHFVKR